MAVSLNQEDYGTLIDPFNGLKDLENKLIRTPLDPVITYSDDPLRMLRAIRFATQLDFSIEKTSLEAIFQERERMRSLQRTNCRRIAQDYDTIIQKDFYYSTK